MTLSWTTVRLTPRRWRGVAAHTLPSTDGLGYVDDGEEDEGDDFDDEMDDGAALGDGPIGVYCVTVGRIVRRGGI